MFKLFHNFINRRKVLKIIGLSALGSTSYGLYNLFNDKKYLKSEWQGNVLNNPARIEIHSNNSKKNNLIYSQINSFVNLADNTFNLQNNKSELVLLNKNKISTNPSPELIDVVKKSKIISELTDGAFDITVQPLWNFYYDHFIVQEKQTYPDREKLEIIKKTINWKNVHIKDNNILLKNNASITLNGIAQGWITDNIVDILRKNNINNTLVDFGETFASGNYQNERPWNIQLVGGYNSNKVIKLTNKAVATSSPSGTVFEPSKKFHHIFNPKTGLSESIFETVSIVSDKAWLSDSIATSALLLDKNNLKTLCNKLKADAYIVKNKNFQNIT